VELDEQRCLAAVLEQVSLQARAAEQTEKDATAAEAGIPAVAVAQVLWPALEPACFRAGVAVQALPAASGPGEPQVATGVPVEPVVLEPGESRDGLPELVAEELPVEWLRGSEPEPVSLPAAVLELDESRPNVMAVRDARLDGTHWLVARSSWAVPIQVALQSSVLIPERAWFQVWFRAGSWRPVAGWFQVWFRWVWQEAGSAAFHSSGEHYSARAERYSEPAERYSEPVFRSQAWSRSRSPVLRRGLARHV